MEVAEVMISSYERQYMDALKNIYENGYSDGTNERTGVATKRLPCIVIQVDLEKEFPILKSKRVFAKTADREIDWIMRKQSNNIHDLNAKIWDEWADEDGSIGTSYGYQVAKPVDIYLDPIHKTQESYRHYDSQVHFVLDYLKECPNGRWAKIDLWNVQELSGMNLVPCCGMSEYNLDGGRLNCTLVQRSGDMGYGVAFNTPQYAMLIYRFAKHLGVKPGIFTHVITDAHIYANQMEGVKEQLRYYETMLILEDFMGDPMDAFSDDWYKAIGTDYDWDYKTAKEVRDHFYKVLESKPKYVIPDGPDGNFSFWDCDVEDCSVQNYTPVKRIDFGDVAV